MNVKKYKIDDVEKILAEADISRPNQGRQENIHTDKIKYNFALTNGNKNIACDMLKNAIQKHNKNGKALRKDAVVMVGFCITLPKQYSFNPKHKKEEDINFFHLLKKGTMEHFGISDNDILLDSIHCDETTPHMHLYIMPRVNNRFNAKALFDDKKKFETFHQSVDSYMKKHCKSYTEGLLLSEEEHILKKTNIPLKELKKIKIDKLGKEIEYQVLKKKVDNAKTTIKQAETAQKELNSINSQLATKKANLSDLEDKIKKATYDERAKATENFYKTTYLENYVMPRVARELGEYRTNSILQEARESFDQKHNLHEKAKEWIRWCYQDVSMKLYKLFHHQNEPKKSKEIEKSHERSL